ncbi:hypothetical protein FB45DRAFT_1036828 [Roridomyces roridus]|uniref:Uncharacterized protein n=1 Tax=Roridomyces roridus TaxID=1738132 RepID=A0AAD7B6Z9_9AGAR|nr:hypothetical protein FB45DRAFT_1036828 [Roridomyces roridus]
MHRCLEIPELVGLVCHYLRTSPDFDIDDLFGPCVVHALELLWETVALLNLFRCLPSDAFEVHKVDGGDRTTYRMQLLRPLQKSDFERVLLHAAHVRCLFSDPEVADLSSIFSAASPLLSESGVFPNLQSLYWMHAAEGFEYNESFLVPQLTEIFINKISPTALTLLPGIASRCRGLAYITLFPRGEAGLRELSGRVISNCVCSWHAIKSLSVEIVDDVAFEHIARCPDLRYLQLCGLPSTFPSSNNEVAFPMLQSLHLCTEIEAVARLLEWAGGISLVKFVAECPEWPTADEVHRLFAAAEKGISHTTLKHFFFHNGHNTAHVATHLILSSSLRRLFCFTNSTLVSIFSAGGVDLDDTTVTDMARSWPYIQLLDFPSFYGAPAPRAALQCLHAFPKYCHHLTKLCISFNHPAVPDILASHAGWKDVESLIIVQYVVSPIYQRESQSDSDVLETHATKRQAGAPGKYQRAGDL